MDIKTLQNQPNIETDKKLQSAFERFSQLLDELRKRKLPDTIVQEINRPINQANAANENPKASRKILKKQQYAIIKLLEKELKIVPKNYYRNTWIPLGMTTFGLPIGVALGTALGNIAFLGIGLPIGMAIGLAVRTEKDKKAAAEGRQLDLEYEL